MGKRACVFVDGENLRHAICELFKPDFDRAQYLPKSARWAEFFDRIVAKADSSAERVRTYWYAIAHVDFYPYRFPHPVRERDKLVQLLSRHQPFNETLRGLEGQGLEREIDGMVSELRARQTQMERRFKGWQIVQNGIAARHPAVEFRRAGAITYDLFTGLLGREKAVDVKLATDMIVLRDIYDVALIVSGDQDYVPAVQVIKDSGRRVINVSFKTRGGKLLPGGAQRLNQETDWCLQIDYADLASFMNIVKV